MIRISAPVKFLTILFVTALIFIFQQAISNASGAPTGSTGAPSESNCTSCHTGTAITNSSSVTIITNMTNGQYIPDSTYQIKIRAKKTGCVKFGFSVTLLNSNASPTKLGTLSVPSGNTKVQLSTGTRDYMTQTSSGTSPVYTDSTEWVIHWKAPSTLSGDARLYIAALASNNDNAITSDETHVKDFTFPQTTNVPVASITTNVNNGCINDSVYFQGSGTNGTNDYQWTFPGGTPNTSTSQNQWVKFTNGTKLCSLRVANNIMYSAYATKSLTVYSNPNANISYNNATLLCEGDSTSLSTTPSASYSYQWQKDGINISGATGPQYFAKLSASYTVVVTSNNGCSTTSAPVTLSFNTSPVAILTSLNNTTSTCQGDTIFLKTNSGNGYSYYWYKDNVLQTQSLDSTYPVLQSGDYTVRIYSTLGCSTLSNALTISFYNQPSGTIASQTDSICAGDFVKLSAFNLDTIVMYQWYKDSVQINGAIQQDYDVTTPGSYMVDMISNRGCKVTLPAKQIRVNPLPSANFIDTARNGCTYLVQIRFPGTYSTTWFKDGSIFNSNTSNITVTQSGTYYVIITNSYGCTVTTNSLVITIPTPPANNIDSVKVGCAYSLKLRHTGNFNWQWQLDGVTFNASDSIVTATQTGTYSILISNNQGCTINTNSIHLTIPVDLPDTNITPKLDAEFCSDSAGVKYQVPSVAGMVYRWYKNGTLITGANQNFLTIKDSGSYYVNVDNGLCSFNSSSRHVKVNPMPTAAITGILEFCSGDSSVLTTNSITGATYQWYKDNQPIPNTNSNIYIARTSGMYNAKATLAPCFIISNTLNITSNPSPALPIITRNVNLLTSTVAPSYQWYKNGTIISGATQQSYTITADGNYSVQVTDAKGCKNISAVMPLTFNGINGNAYYNSVTAFPNPVQENLYLNFTETGLHDITITDASGRNLKNISIDTKNAILDFSTMDAGIYFVKVASSDVSGILRVVKN